MLGAESLLVLRPFSAAISHWVTFVFTCLPALTLHHSGSLLFVHSSAGVSWYSFLGAGLNLTAADNDYENSLYREIRNAVPGRNDEQIHRALQQEIILLEQSLKSLVRARQSFSEMVTDHLRHNLILRAVLGLSGIVLISMGSAAFFN